MAKQADLDVTDDVRIVSSDVSCEACVHKDVCGVYWGIAPMFQQWAERTEGEAPFDLDDMAVICRYYDES